MSTGISHSHTLNDLSSDVETNLRLLSQNVIVLTAPKRIDISKYVVVFDTSKKVRKHFKLNIVVPFFSVLTLKA